VILKVYILLLKCEKSRLISIVVKFTSNDEICSLKVSKCLIKNNWPSMTPFKKRLIKHESKKCTCFFEINLLDSRNEFAHNDTATCAISSNTPISNALYNRFNNLSVISRVG